jgi:hypothetical protein
MKEKTPSHDAFAPGVPNTKVTMCTVFPKVMSFFIELSQSPAASPHAALLLMINPRFTYILHRIHFDE